MMDSSCVPVQRDDQFRLPLADHRVQRGVIRLIKQLDATRAVLCIESTTIDSRGQSWRRLARTRTGGKVLVEIDGLTLGHVPEQSLRRQRPGATRMV